MADAAQPSVKLTRDQLVHQRQQRLAEIETMLARRLSERRVEQDCAKRWGVAGRTVRLLVTEVRSRWAIEADGLDRAAKRAHMHATACDLYARAMGRTEVVRDGAGNPIMEPGTGRPLLREVPDLKTAVRAADLIARLHGLLQTNIIVQPTAAPAQSVAANASREDLLFFARTGRWPEGHAAAAPPSPPASTH